MKFVPLLLVLTCMVVATLSLVGCGQRVYPKTPDGKILPSSSY